MTRKQKRIPMDAVVAREGDVFMLIIANYWAKGDTVAEAIKGIRDVSGRSRSRIEEDGWCLISSEPKGFMDEMGYIMWHDDKKYAIIAEYDPKK